MKNYFTQKIKNNTLYSFFCIHFILVILSLLPINVKIANSYTSSVLNQKWSMFAPNPINFSSSILHKCNGDNISKELFKPFKLQLQKIPLIHLQKKVFLYQSLNTTILEEKNLFLKTTPCKDSQKCADKFVSHFKKTHIGDKLKKIYSKECRGELKALTLVIKYSLRPIDKKKSYKIEKIRLI